MATPHRIQAIEKEHEKPIEDLILSLLNKHGTQKAAADALGLSQATISKWLKENHYESKVVYVKKGKQP